MTFLKSILYKWKAKKLLATIERTEKQFCRFAMIVTDNKRDEARLAVLRKDQRYADIVSRYQVCMSAANRHNETVKTIVFSCNSILQQYPIAKILDDIGDYTKEKLKQIAQPFSSFSVYVIPDTFLEKDRYLQYDARLQEVIAEFETIGAQKRLIREAEKAIAELPDRYLDYAEAEEVFAEAKRLVGQLRAYSKQYYASPKIDNSVLDRHNETFIAAHIDDPVFDDVNGFCLDEEQRRAILCDAKSNLVIAGAGAGKTLTVCGKVRYLLEKGYAKPQEILLLSYSAESAKDLNQKVARVAEGLTVSTFHALGYRILTEINGKKKAVEDQLKSYITAFFREEIEHNFVAANEILSYISLYFYDLSREPERYESEGDLYQELKKKELVTLKERLQKLSADRSRKETLKKELVKSQEELAIANYLFTNGIHYEYEKSYEKETATLEKRQYTPDFYLTDYGLYLEHYGIDRNGKAMQFGGDAGKNYVQSMQWKRKIHQENGTKCLETFSYQFKEGTVFDDLRQQLVENGVQFKPLSETEILTALRSVFEGRDFSSFLNLLVTFLALYKAGQPDASGFDRLQSQLMSRNDDVKGLSLVQYDARRAGVFLNLCKEIYSYYIKKLRQEDKIDFDDMILQSTAFLDRTDGFRYKYIIVDEFQDISQSRTRFLQKLIAHGNAKLFAVGDDWQAIYRFAGCDINVFLDFDKIFENAKLNYITTTHRNSMELQRIVEPFITANPSQYKKHIRSAKHQKDPVRIVFHNNDKPKALLLALNDIARQAPHAEVLLLGRNRHDIEAYCNRDFGFRQDGVLRHRNVPTLRLYYSTVHASKGLEKEFVILLSGENAVNGFPNQTEDDAVLTLVLGKNNLFRFAEERRLFYVALTRTKNVVYILSDRLRTSEFVKEIEDKCLILGDIEAEKTEKTPEIFCPWCKTGTLKLKERGYGEQSFYGCSNYPYCTYTNDNLQSVQSKMRCPQCGDFLMMRKGKYGKFLGCHNYPRCKYTKEITPIKK